MNDQRKMTVTRLLEGYEGSLEIGIDRVILKATNVFDSTHNDDTGKLVTRKRSIPAFIEVVFNDDGTMKLAAEEKSCEEVGGMGCGYENDATEFERLLKDLHYALMKWQFRPKKSVQLSLF